MVDKVPASPTHRDVIVSGLRLHLLQWGPASAPTLVFLHGGGLSAAGWSGVCDRLATNFRCVAVDLRGHGDSEWSPVADYRLNAYAADIEALLPAIVEPPAAVVGHSLGAFVGLAVAARDPSMVGCFIAVDASPLSGAAGQEAAERIVAFMLSRDEFDTWDDAVAHCRSFTNAAPSTLRRNLEAQLRPTPQGRLVWKHDLRSLRAEGGLRALVAEIADLAPLVPMVNCPALVIRAERGMTRQTADAFAARLRNGRAITIADAGHNVHRDQPASLARTIASFVNKHR